MLLRYWKKVVRIVHLANKGSYFTENSTECMEHAMQKSGATPHILDQTWLSTNYASLA